LKLILARQIPAPNSSVTSIICSDNMNFTDFYEWRIVPSKHGKFTAP